MNTISFEVANKGKTVVAFIPLVDSISLTELATEYERNHHWQPAGGYGGLIPSYYNYGPIDSYLLGDAHGAGFDDSERIALLGCECGEVGCWPLWPK